METEPLFVNAHTHHQIPTGVIGVRNYTQKQELSFEDSMVSYGLHPWYISQSNVDQKLSQLKNYLDKGLLNAIGECGLDKLCKTNFIIQQVVFGHQIRLAIEYQLPLIIHSVKTHDLIIQAYDKYKPNKPWILHGFNGNRQQIEEFSKRNIYISIGGILLREHSKIKENLQFVPKDRLLFETDNAKTQIKDVYQAASNILNSPIEDLKKQIFNNFASCFEINL